MNSEEKGNNKKSGDTLKLRHFIINLIYKNSHDSVKLPSIRQLTTQFNLAKSTVQLIIESLIKEGYLYSKQGIGTFTNPAKGFVFHGAKPPPLIGIIWGSGTNFFYDHRSCLLLGSVSSRITETGWSIRNLSLSSASPSSIIKEINHSHIDGLIWVNPGHDKEELLETLQVEYPVVAINNYYPFENVSGVSLDFDKAGKELAKQLILENRSNLLFAIAGNDLILSFNRLRQVYEEDKLDYNETILDNTPSELFKNLEEILASNPPPDVLFINGRQVDQCVNLLKKYNIDPVNDCRVIAIQDIISSQPFRGILLEEPFDDMGIATAEMMHKLIDQKGNKVINESLPVKIKEYNA